MKLTKVLLQVPYFASTFVILGVFIHPCVSSFLCTDMFLLIRSIVSKKVRSNEQVLLISKTFGKKTESLIIFLLQLLAFTLSITMRSTTTIPYQKV
ncbi:hypothetical protein GW17_00004703 [Ensete ventricosum]|uniref:Uncharacterized protein n=1 Tax=Ensete ventricosum TaxID=4639 RepID=A0A444G751_ENSVE|nr:hypothetical protein B296_00002848 [Ensete ventricosum]RWW30712.1 hypothetical protein GW17_00004703 [Ensete ventricosum]